jgi:phenylacetate-CoA ligase
VDGRYLDPFIETLGRPALEAIQLKKLQLLLGDVLKGNRFLTAKLEAAGVTRPEDVATFADYRRLAFTDKRELSVDQAAHPPYGSNLTWPNERYTRIHQTSGTKGEPLRWLDTDDSWQWWARCWATVYRAAEVDDADRIFFAFSFGPFIGFWSAYEGARSIGALAIPGGGMSSVQRLRGLVTHEASVLVCTPTYALHLAEVAEEEGIDIAGSSVKTTIHAGEPGASLPATKQRIERAWGARCFDHAGATEVGPWGFECAVQAGVHVNEAEFIAEIIDPSTGEPAERGELVLTNLGRMGSPVLRYRTGDQARWSPDPCPCGRTYAKLDGGLIGRIDDALIIRGVNVYPSSIENIIRAVPDVDEFAVHVHRRHELDDLEIRVEVGTADADAVAARIAEDVRHGLGIRVAVETVPRGSLPRFDLKARRVTDHRRP